MKECTGTDKQGVEKSQVSKGDKTRATRPLVSIVLATYNPRLDWLKEQLDSLEEQSYRPLELLILDDCSTKVGLDELQDCVGVCIKSIPYQIMQNEKNLGSTKTFEKLTMLAQGEYISYCDQDDVWHGDKIKVLLNLLNNEKVNLAFSDVIVIDEFGNKKADSITEIRPRHILHEGSYLSNKLLIQNFVIGCTMLIKSRIAKGVIPFIEDMVHDHYLALMTSLDGELALCNEPLVSYRIHDSNQTNTLTQVNNKRDYYNYKIKAFHSRIEQLENLGLRYNILEFDNIKKWAEARNAYYNGEITKVNTIWKYRKFDYSVSLFELIILKMPDFAFKYALKMIKRGSI